MIDKLKPSEVFITLKGKPSSNDMPTPKWFDKINELVEEVNIIVQKQQIDARFAEERLYKLEQHKHETVGDAWKGETSEPIMQSEELPIIETNNLNFATGAALAEAIRDIKDLKQVIQEVYYLADRSNFCGKGMDYRLKNIIDILKPYIEEK